MLLGNFQNGDFDRLRILVIGDMIEDHYLFGRIERQNPEAPVPLVRIKSEKTAWGGACNVHTAMKKLGVTASYLHDDEKICPKKTRIVVKGQQVIRFDLADHATPLSKNTQEDFINIARWLSPVLHGIVISDYAKGVVCGDWIERLVSACSGTPFFIDGHPSNYRLYPPEAYLKINHRELKEITGTDSIQAGVDEIKKDHHAVIVTCGENGTVYVDDGYPVCRAPVYKRKVYDVTGAGDAWIAAFVPAFLQSGKISSSIDFANLVAGISVEHIGSYHPSWEEIESGHAISDGKEVVTA